MSETVIAIASTPSTTAGRCAWAWGTTTTSDNAQIASTLRLRRNWEGDNIISPDRRKFTLPAPRVFCARNSQPFQQVISDSQRIRHDRQGRGHGSTGREKASVDPIAVF